VLARCREFSCLPDELLAEDSELLRLLEIEQLGQEGGGIGDR